MQTQQSPFSSFERLAQELAGSLKPPPWVVDETQRRLVLLLNHILRQEPAAMERLMRHKGSVLRVQWRVFSVPFVVTPAGLFDIASDGVTPDLRIAVATESPLEVARAVLSGDKPRIHIEGDVQLAAEVNWLVDHVRWDIEEDLSRLLGDGPSHLLGETARRVVQALRHFTAPLRGKSPRPDDGSGASA